MFIALIFAAVTPFHLSGLIADGAPWISYFRMAYSWYLVSGQTPLKLPVCCFCLAFKVVLVSLILGKWCGFIFVLSVVVVLLFLSFFVIVIVFLFPFWYSAFVFVIVFSISFFMMDHFVNYCFSLSLFYNLPLFSLLLLLSSVYNLRIVSIFIDFLSLLFIIFVCVRYSRHLSIFSLFFHNLRLFQFFIVLSHFPAVSAGNTSTGENDLCCY